MPKKITIADLFDFKSSGKRFTAVSCYDYTTSRIVADAGVEMILVGDSAAQVILGYNSTLPVTMDFMVTITAAARRAAPDVCLAADMPFLSYQVSIQEAVRNAGRFVIESGADIVKVEASESQLPVIKALNNADIPVMAHIGIRPQSIIKRGKLKAEGTTADQAITLIDLADRMIDAGACVLLLEGTAREVAAVISQRVPVPVLSCGAGPDCDGQILIISDILGLSKGLMPKFSKSYVQLYSQILEAIKTYGDEISSGIFPDDDHSYHMKSEQLEILKKSLETRN